MSIRYLNIKLVIISDLRHLDIILKYIFSMTLTILKPDD